MGAPVCRIRYFILVHGGSGSSPCATLWLLRSLRNLMGVFFILRNVNRDRRSPLHRPCLTQGEPYARFVVFDVRGDVTPNMKTRHASFMWGIEMRVIQLQCNNNINAYRTRCQITLHHTPT